MSDKPWNPEVERIRKAMMERFSDKLSMEEIAEFAYSFAAECAAPAPQPLISALKELRRWDCFVNREILPPGMSPRENGKWVKWTDIEKLFTAATPQVTPTEDKSSR